MSFFKVFCITFPIVWLALTFISAEATHKPFGQCFVSLRMDCE